MKERAVAVLTVWHGSHYWQNRTCKQYNYKQ